MLPTLRLAALLAALALPTLASDDTINVFIVTHTHDDVGWIKTVDEYYVSEVQWILDTAVVDSLLANPARKMTYVEISYFQRWWNEQSTATRDKVRFLVANGQLEFNLGGMVMNDEATTNYANEIHQMTEGALFLRQQLNATVTVGWHIDPFGHSSMTPTLWSSAGFDCFGINRIDVWDKAARKEDKQLEFVWRGSSSLGPAGDMWTHVMDSHYTTPSMIAYELDVLLQDDPNLPTLPTNIQDQAAAFVQLVQEHAAWFRHNNVLIPFGNDFAHQNGQRSFKQMDALIQFVNSNASNNVNVQYAFLSDYTKAVHADNLTWDVYTGDFFPYATNEDAYWVGYYTSRPQLKGLITFATGQHRAAEQLSVLVSALTPAPLPQPLVTGLGYMRQALAEAQHHDAISGTETVAVAADYTVQLNVGGQYSKSVIAAAVQALQPAQPANSIPGYSALLGDEEVFADAPGFRNLAGVPCTVNSSVSVTVYNSLGWDVTQFVQMSTNCSNIASVVDASTGRPTRAQLDPAVNGTLPNGDTLQYLLHWLVRLPPLGFVKYIISFGPSTGLVALGVAKPVSPGTSASIENDYYQLSFSPRTGRLVKWVNKATLETHSVSQDLWQYVGSLSGQVSGAYVFNPNDPNRLITAPSPIDGNMVNIPVFVSSYGWAPNSFPVSVATVRTGAATDVFAATITDFDGYAVEFGLQRIDAKPWEYTPAFDFFAYPASFYPSGMQAGTVDVGPSANGTALVTITFYTALGTVPVVILTPQLGSPDGTTPLVATLTEVTNSSATAVIRRIDGAGWKDDVTLNWLLFDITNGIAGVLDAEVVDGPASSTGTTSIVLPLEPSMQGSPGVLATVISASGRSFAVSTSDFTAPNCRVINVRSLDGSGWGPSDVSVMAVQIVTAQQIVPVIDVDEFLSTTIIQGPFVSTAIQAYRQNYTQLYRAYSDGSGSTANQTDLQCIEVTYALGAIDNGFEVVTRFDTDLHTGDSGAFLTDSNGLEMLDRHFDWNATDPLAGNFYPAVTAAAVYDASSGAQLTVMLDRAHGVSNHGSDGSLDIMLHRRCLYDDGFGVGEALDDQTAIRAVTRVFLEDQTTTAVLRHKQQHMLTSPLQMTSPAPVDSSALDALVPAFSGLTGPLPLNVHLLTFQQLYVPVDDVSTDSSSVTGDVSPTSPVLLRLQHLYPVGEHPVYSQPVTVNITAIFNAPALLHDITEMGLTASETLDEIAARRLHWRTSDEAQSGGEEPVEVPLATKSADPFVITLQPREIRTFILNRNANT